MKQRCWGAILLAGWGLAASCARGDRDVQLALSLFGGDAGPKAPLAARRSRPRAS
jgi:hypothetical protein